MKLVPKILLVAACLFAVLVPAMYAFVFGVCWDIDALVATAVTGSCIILGAGGFKRVSGLAFASAVSVLSTATLVGFFVHFPDSGSSGPLPYEWLNGYFQFSTPLLLIAIGVRFFKHDETAVA
jgi:hypothetical protein